MTAELFAAPPAAPTLDFGHVVGGIILMVGLTLLLGGIFLCSLMAYLPTERIPAKWRPLQGLVRRLFEGDESAVNRDESGDEGRERAMLYQQLQLIHPDADPGMLAMMVERMQRSAQRSPSVEPPAPVQPRAVQSPRPAAPEISDISDTVLFATEVDLYLNFALDIQKDHTVHVSAKQYKALQQYCAFRFDAIETPEFTFGRFGLLLLTDS